MVGLRLTSGFKVEEGDDLVAEVVPWAAALSDRLLCSHCAACFSPCSTLRFPCPGPCHGALLYCSHSCRTLDLPFHSRSAECKLLSLIKSCATPVSSSSFPSLGGTCDIRTALRLLDQHYSLNHITPFLAASQCAAHGVDHPRLGGLLSNRFSLLQTSPSNDENEDEELRLATELGEAAMLMCYVRYSTPAVAHVCESPDRADHSLAAHMDDCITEHTLCAGVCDDAEGQVEGVYMTGKTTSEDVLPHVLEYTEGSRHLDFHGKEHVPTMVENVNEKLPCLTQAGKMLLVQEVLCQVFTNGVRVQMDTWIADKHLNVQSTDLGTAVFGPSLSWIDHSCRPNAFFSFVLAHQVMSRESTRKAPIEPFMDVKGLEDTWGLRSGFPSFRPDSDLHMMPDPRCLQHYSPRARLRSIRNIEGLEQICISYIDVLQPKNMRKQELWLKYRFHCNCERCQVKSTEDVDGILQKLGPYDNQSDMLILEKWLCEKAQDGFKEFLENDNPLACCEILEGALVKLVHRMDQSYINAENLQCWPPQEGLNCGEHQCLEDSIRNRRHIKMHLMHHLCLNIYMMLSSSYKILAIGFRNSSDKGPSEGNAAASPITKRKDVECSILSAAYSLVQATTIQRLCDFGEPGLLAITARFWLQNWEAFIKLISKLDSYFHLDSMSEMQNLLSKFMSEFKSIIFFPDDNFIWNLKDLFSLCGSLKNCDSTSQLLWFSVMTLWPFLRSTSPFLSNIETPFDVSEVCVNTVESWTGFIESKDDWLCYRGEALICALCSLRHSFMLMNLLYGSGDRLIEVMQDFLSVCFRKGSAMHTVHVQANTDC